jgi:hypothetical protein
MDKELEKSRATRSLYLDKPWASGGAKDSSELPLGWTWNSALNKWNEPPAYWKFNGKSWVRAPGCRAWKKSSCRFGNKCRFFHAPKIETENSATVSSPTSSNIATHTAVSTKEAIPLKPPPHGEAAKSQDRDDTGNCTEESAASSSTPSDGKSDASTDISVPDEVPTDAPDKAPIEAPDEVPAEAPEKPPEQGQEKPVEVEESSNATEKPKPTDLPDAEYIAKILAVPGFGESGQVWDTVERQTTVLRRQGADLKEECRMQRLALSGKDGLDYVQAMEHYYNYLRASDFLAQEAEYVQREASSCSSCTLYPYDSDCVADVPRTMDTGLLLINHAEKLCARAISDIQKYIEEKVNLIVVLAIHTQKVPEALESLYKSFNTQFDFQKDYGIDSLQLALDTFQQMVDEKWKKKMKLQGGRDGPSVSLCIRKLLSAHTDEPQKVKHALKELLDQVHKRQIQRLIKKHKIDDGLGADQTDQNDDFLFTSEDLIGTSPDTPFATLKEWHELQQMIGLKEVKN